jgi:hypothetical protein
MKTMLSIRPGNPVQERAAEFKAIESFEEI